MKIINSVLGFDFNLELIDRDGELVRTGVKHTYMPNAEDIPNIGTSFGNTRWFTNFNESLLTKIRDYKRLNT